MKTMVTWVVGIVLAVLVASVVLPFSWDYLQQGRGKLDQRIAKQIESGQLIITVQSKLDAKRGELRSVLAGVIMAEPKLRSTQTDRDELKNKLAEQDQAFLAGMNLLENTTDDAIVTPSGKVSRSQVQADCDRRAVYCEGLRVKLAAAEQNCATLAKAIEDAKSSVAEGKQKIEAMEADLETLKIKIESSEAIAKIQKLAASLSGANVDLDEDRHLQELNRRIAEADAGLALASMGGSNQFLDYGTSSSAVSASAAEKYQAKLGALSAPDAEISKEVPLDKDGFLKLNTAKEPAVKQ